jgi:hypothetical protein
METFCLPYREILERFTKSELVLMGWRSAEQAYKWKQKTNKTKIEDHDESVTEDNNVKRKQYDGVGPERMPNRFFAQETIKDERGRVIAHAGDFNLAQVSGEEARRYFESVLKIPLPPGISKIAAAEDETTQQIRNAYGIRR